MGLVSPPWFNLSPVISNKQSNFSLLRSMCLCPPSRLPSSLQVPISFAHRKDAVLCSGDRHQPLHKRKTCLVSCRMLNVEDELEDAEACELVNGSELKIGEGSDTVVHAYLFKAVKNNNGTGILLLSDIFGFEDSLTRDFAYRVACNGYNVLVPDLFRGDPWSKDQAKAMFEQWIAKKDPSRVAKDIDTSTKWMVDEFTDAGIPKKLGIIGFCYGGGRVLEVLARDENSSFGTGVSFYGTRIDQSAAVDVKVPVLFVTGDDDTLCPVDIVNELEKKIGKNSKVVVFKGRGHGFAHRPESPEEDEDADEAFMIMRNWLHDHLLI